MLLVDHFAIAKHRRKIDAVLHRGRPDAALDAAQFSEHKDRRVDVVVVGQIGAGQDEIADAAIAEIEAGIDARAKRLQVVEDGTAQSRLHFQQHRMPALGKIGKFVGRLVSTKIVGNPRIADLHHLAGTALAMRHRHQRLADIADRQKVVELLAQDFRAAATVPARHHPRQMHRPPRQGQCRFNICNDIDIGTRKPAANFFKLRWLLCGRRVVNLQSDIFISGIYADANFANTRCQEADVWFFFLFAGSTVNVFI